MERPAGDDSRCGILERGLLAATLFFYAFAVPVYFSLVRPGFYRYDEEGLIDQIQTWREGLPLVHGIGWSSVHKWICAGLVALGGPHLYLLHLPTYTAVLLETPLLIAWIRPKAGERAALWAALANLVAALTFARASSMLGCGMMPAFFLVGALACERWLEPWPSFAVGFALAAMLLDYEGWTAALLFLAPYALFLRRGRLRSQLCGLAGAFGGLATACFLSPNVSSKLLGRLGVSRQLGLLGQVWDNVRHLLLPSDRLLFADAPFHSWPTPWLWLPVLLGALLAFRRQPWFLWLCVCGASALTLKSTASEPQRLALAYLGLCCLAGLGLARLWAFKQGPRFCLILLALGAADEAWALIQVPSALTARFYGDSVQWTHAADWLAERQPPEGWHLISGLGSHQDAAFRFLADGAGVRPGGRVPVALVHDAFWPATSALAPAPFVRFGPLRPVSLWFPGPGDARRLESVEALLAPLHQLQVGGTLPEIQRGSLLWLGAPGHGDPWARSVAWYEWLFSSVLAGRVSSGPVAIMLQEPLVSALAPDLAASILRLSHPDLARQFGAKAEGIDPSLKNLDLDERLERY